MEESRGKTLIYARIKEAKKKRVSDVALRVEKKNVCL
jgi:hypothetical protein